MSAVEVSTTLHRSRRIGIAVTSVLLILTGCWSVLDRHPDSHLGPAPDSDGTYIARHVEAEAGCTVHLSAEGASR